MDSVMAQSGHTVDTHSSIQNNEQTMKRDSINVDLMDKLVNTSINDENSKDSARKTTKGFDLNSIISS